MVLDFIHKQLGAARYGHLGMFMGTPTYLQDPVEKDNEASLPLSIAGSWFISPLLICSQFLSGTGTALYLPLLARSARSSPHGALARPQLAGRSPRS